MHMYYSHNPVKVLSATNWLLYSMYVVFEYFGIALCKAAIAWYMKVDTNVPEGSQDINVMYIHNYYVRNWLAVHNNYRDIC